MDNEKGAESKGCGCVYIRKIYACPVDSFSDLRKHYGDTVISRCHLARSLGSSNMDLCANARSEGVDWKTDTCSQCTHPFSPPLSKIRFLTFGAPDSQPMINQNKGQQPEIVAGRRASLSIASGTRSPIPSIHNLPPHIQIQPASPAASAAVQYLRSANPIYERERRRLRRASSLDNPRAPQLPINPGFFPYRGSYGQYSRHLETAPSRPVFIKLPEVIWPKNGESFESFAGRARAGGIMVESRIRDIWDTFSDPRPESTINYFD